VHAASFYTMPELAGELATLFKEARSCKATTSLAVNDDPSGRWDRLVLDPVLRLTDILFVDGAEAQALTGHPVLADAAGILARRGPLVVVKDEALVHDGSAVIRADGPAAEAGYVAAVLNGLGRERALELAVESAR
jgi:sugar/nucleoside kinase (ribokinase family)